MSCEKGQRFCSEVEKMEELLGPPAGGGSQRSGAPQERYKRTWRKLLELQDLFSPVRALILALLLALVLAIIGIVILASAVTLHAQPAGREAASRAAVLSCPDGWVGYRKVCYYLSKVEEEEGSWEWSQERCLVLGASLAVLWREWEMEFLWRLKGNVDYWVGLRGQGERLEWVDGSGFNQTVEVQGQGPCVYLNDHDVVRSSCSLPRPYLCSKPQAVM